MGMFDGLFGGDPNQQAQLAMAAGLLSSRGNAANAIGGALSGAQGAYTQGQLNAAKLSMNEAQIKQLTAATQMEQQKADQQAMMLRNLGTFFQQPASQPNPSSMAIDAANGQMGGANAGPSLQAASMLPQAQAAASQQRPSPFSNPGALEQIAAIKAMGGPDLLDYYKQAQSGTQLQPGTFRLLPNGQREYIADPTKGYGIDTKGNVGVLPGFTNAVGTITAASEEPKALAGARYNPVKAYDSANQRETTTYPFLTAQLPGSTSPYAPPSSVPPRGMGGTSAGGVPSAGGPQARPGLGIPAGPTPREKASGASFEELNNNWIKSTLNPVNDADQAAQSLLQSNQVARDALKGIGSTGWTTEVKGVAANALGALGVKDAQNYASDIVRFNQAAGTRLWTQLNAAKGPQTEGDASRAKQVFVQIKNPTQANEYILDLMDATAQRDHMRAQFYNNALPIARQNGDLTEIDREWRARMPSIFSMPTMQRWQSQAK